MPTEQPPSILTIGHSTLSMDEFIARLRSFDVKTLADIRSLPGSRRLPQFNRESLEAALPAVGIAYVWLPALGGRRRDKLKGASPNKAWQHPSFRAYADYMLTPEFAAGINNLMDIARRGLTAIMCAEALYWQCHRRLVSDYLVAHEVPVTHIMGEASSRPHALTPEVRIRADGTIIYPPTQAELL